MVIRFLKRNCINIPFYACFFALLCFASHLDRPIEPQGEIVQVSVAGIQRSVGCNETVEGMIAEKCDEYNVPYDVALAIARLETGHFTSKAFTECNNVGGLSEDEVPMKFDTLEAGIERFVSNLSENYFKQGYDTVEEISEKYCPVNAEVWAVMVNSLKGEK